MQSMLLFVVGTIGSSMLCYATPYTPETLPAKIGAFTLFTSIMGVTLAPLIAIAGTHIHVHANRTTCSSARVRHWMYRIYGLCIQCPVKLIRK